MRAVGQAQTLDLNSSGHVQAMVAALKDGSGMGKMGAAVEARNLTSRMDGDRDMRVGAADFTKFPEVILTKDDSAQCEASASYFEAVVAVRGGVGAAPATDAPPATEARPLYPDETPATAASGEVAFQPGGR